MTTPALVLDAEQRSALAVVRSLVRKGVAIETASAQRTPLAAAARGVSGNVTHPDPGQSVSAFLAWIESIQDRQMIAVTDSSSMLVRCGLGAIDHGYERLTNKATLLDLAGAEGIPTPRWALAASIHEAISAAETIGFPTVLKPVRSKVHLGDRIVSTSVRIAGNARQIERVLGDSVWFPSLPVLIQEWIPGHGEGVFCLHDRDHAIAWFAHRRLREKPPTGGVSVLCESVAIDPVLRSHAEALLRAAEYRGVAMIEFRVDSTGLPYLMEVNARFWGSLQLAIDCGVDFPWLHWQMMQGERLAPIRQYAIGKRLRWLLGDLDSLLLVLRSPAHSTEFKRKAAAAFVSSSFDSHCRQEVLRLKDPLPAFREFAHWVSSAVGLVRR